jgi:hypothetical protein
MKFLFSLLAAFAIVQACIAQKSVASLKAYMEKVRASSHDPLPLEILNDRHVGELVTSLKPYFTDTISAVRGKAFYILRRIAVGSNEKKLKHKAIETLVGAVSDTDPFIGSDAVRGLQDFRAGDFNGEARNAIASLLASNARNRDELIRIAGFLGLTEQVPLLNEFVRSAQNSKTKWAARLALSRIGDEVATNSILAGLAGAVIGDDFVYDILPDLVYTRNSNVFKRIAVIMNSDEPLCSSGNPDSGRNIPCGYRILEQIAPVIKNFPVKTDKSGDLITTDYAGALREAREWFVKNESFHLLTDIY